MSEVISAEFRAFNPVSEEATVRTHGHRKNYPSRARPRPWENRTFPLRTKVAGLATAAALTFFGGGDNIINNVAANVLPSSPLATRALDSDRGVTIVPLGTSGKPDANLSSKDSVEFQVYKQYGEQRMLSWMGLDRLSGRDRENLEKQIGEMEKVIKGNPSFEGMKKVMVNHSRDIIAAASKYNIPPEVMLSLSLIENGGAENMVSGSGAVGYMQLMPDKSPDNGPRDAQKASFYIADMKDRFGGDLGIAVWGYHAGEGNVYHALQVYFNNTQGTKFGDITEMSETAAAKMAATYKQLISENKVNLFMLFSNKAVQDQVLSHLEDETELYAWKVIAANIIINQQLSSFQGH